MDALSYSHASQAQSLSSIAHFGSSISLANTLQVNVQT
jgi:hypothetical protein